jgi:hypothetical protein
VITGAVAGLLAIAVTLGVASLTAALARPQASPVTAASAFFDHEHGRTVPLLGMYATIGLIAMGIGILARTRTAIGVVGIGAIGLLGAFVAITRPQSHTADVIPSIAGGFAGIGALLLLFWAAKRAGVWRSSAGARRPAAGARQSTAGDAARRTGVPREPAGGSFSSPAALPRRVPGSAVQLFSAATGPMELSQPMTRPGAGSR